MQCQLPTNTTYAISSGSGSIVLLFNVTTAFQAGNWVSFLGTSLNVSSYTFYASSPNSTGNGGTTIVVLEPSLSIKVSASQNGNATAEWASWTNFWLITGSNQPQWPPLLSPSQTQTLFDGLVTMRFIFPCDNQNVFFEIAVLSR